MSNDSNSGLDDLVEGADARIRVRAYHLWEEAGRPDGRHDEFWHQAEEDEREHNKEIAVAAGGKPITEGAASASDRAGSAEGGGIR